MSEHYVYQSDKEPKNKTFRMRKNVKEHGMVVYLKVLVRASEIIVLFSQHRIYTGSNSRFPTGI